MKYCCDRFQEEYPYRCNERAAYKTLPKYVTTYRCIKHYEMMPLNHKLDFELIDSRLGSMS